MSPASQREQEFQAFCIAIGRMPEQSRNAFVLRQVYDYSYEDVAKQCGEPVREVRRHINAGAAVLEAVVGRNDCQYCATELMCREALTVKFGRWFCTRTPGHEGPHVACGPDEHSLASWADRDEKGPG